MSGVKPGPSLFLVNIFFSNGDCFIQYVVERDHFQMSIVEISTRKSIEEDKTV